MYHLIIDTCVWIDLSKKFPDLRDKLMDLVERKKVRLILPQIIVEEWNRQKPKILEEKDQSVRGMIKNAKALSQYLDADTADKFKGILDEFQEQKEKVQAVALAGVRSVEHLFDHPTTVLLQTTDTAKLQAADFALAKKAPFGNKNSMADALIVFCAIEYLAKEGLTGCIFVSSNPQDFSSSSNPGEIHGDLKELFDRYRVAYFTNIALAINEVEANLVSDESIQTVDQTIRLDAIQEAFRSFREYDRQLMESLKAAGGGSTIQEALRSVSEQNRQFMDSIRAAGGFSVIDEAFRTIHEHDRQLMESLKAAGGFSTVQEALRSVSEQNRQFMESIRAAGGFSAVEEAFRTIREHDRQLMESLKAAGGFSTVQEALRSISEQNRQFMESIKAAGGFSAIQEAFRTIREHDRQVMESLRAAQESTLITSGSEAQKKEPRASNDDKDGESDKPDGAQS